MRYTEKQVEILKMIGYKWHLPRYDLYSKVEPPFSENGKVSYAWYRHNENQFWWNGALYTDWNELMIGIEWIENLKTVDCNGNTVTYDFIIRKNQCYIETSDEITVVRGEEWDCKIDLVFDTVYKFSQYLKEL